MKRIIFSLCVLFWPIGCGSVQEADAWTGSRFLNSATQVQDPRFAALLHADAPRLQIGFLNSGLNGAVLLVQQDGEFKTWLSPEGGAITFRDGMLHSLIGLGGGLLASENAASLSLVRASRQGIATRLHTFLTGNDTAQTRSYRCEIEPRGDRRINIGEREVASVLIRETCVNLTQSFFNLYWVFDGEIVQSRQWAGEFIGPITTRIVN